jgi:hypothetical protein
MTVNAVLAEVCCACVPAASLVRLAPLRVRAGIRVRLVGECAWLWWTAGDEVVLQCVLAVRDVEIFERREGRWHRLGRRIPAFDVPDDAEARPLLHVLTPSLVQAESGTPAFEPMRLTLVRDDRPRVASALCCTLSDLSVWAEGATSKQLESLQAVRAGARVLLRGERLPILSANQRYWGRTILTPLGFRPQPELPDGALREALRLRNQEIALLAEDGFEAIDGQLFQPLTRAGVRLAEREGR